MKFPFTDHHYHFLSNKPLQYAIFAVLPIAVVCFVFSPPYLITPVPLSSSSPPLVSASSSSPPPSQPLQAPGLKNLDESKPCDYAKGKWVPTKSSPLYNGTSCSSIKHNQNCMNNGKDELGFLFWKWKPDQCNLPRFDPSAFLNLLRNKHLAFIGDSLARNQLESLICLISSAYPPKLVYSNGDGKFRKWRFDSYNVSISVYWSPFLVNGTEKNSDRNYNRLFFDGVDERWGSDLGLIDVVVLSIGHWYLHPAVYYEGGSVIGCHVCDMINHTETGFYEVFRKGCRVALRAIVERKSVVDVFVTTFSPSHFEGEWDKAGACPKTAPYEKEVEGMDSEMRRVGLEEVDFAMRKVGRRNSGRVRVNALDITKLAILRPDGHPGPYMNPFPFANGIQDRVQNDCVHWCLPGVIDTWNEIMLEIMKRL